MQTPDSPFDGAPPDERPINPKKLIPQSDASLFDVGSGVEARWTAVPALTLLWLTRAAYSTALADFGTNLTEKRRVAAERSPGVERLVELDDVAEDALPFLRGYIDEEAGSKTKGKAQYTAHGLEQKGKRYRWAIDRNERVKGVQMLLAKLGTGASALPYANRKYGAAFWQAWLAEYKPLVEKSGADAGTVSHKVSRKDEAKKTVRKALQAIIFLLKANYPDTFEAELRQWGFRKESY
ncbi:MAG: hypothetical protein H7330_15685 [Hymenobacteraceae bacterium]|nr:hypothetical protein [Hymenobacteraceae bacterium]